MSVKLERLGNIMVEEISKIIRDEVKDEDVKYVTINHVDITSDLSFAKVYFTTLYDDQKETVTKALKRASKFIKGELSQRMLIRKMPDLIFVYDESITYGSKIENIIKELHEEDK